MDLRQDQVNDGVEQPPQAKRRISRLQHMKVSRSAPCDQGEDAVHKPCSVSQQCGTTVSTGSDALKAHDVAGKAASAGYGCDPACSGPCTQVQDSIQDMHGETQKAESIEHAMDDGAATAASPQRVSACQQELEQQCHEDGQQHPAPCSPTPPGSLPPEGTSLEFDAVVNEEPTLMSSSQQHAAACATKEQHCTAASLQLDDVAVGTAGSVPSQEQQQAQLPKEPQQAAQQAALVPQDRGTAASSELQDAGVDVPEDATTAQAAAQQPEHPVTASSPVQAGLAAARVEDEDDDDDWEDQPAPLVPVVEDPEASTEGVAGSKHARQPAGAGSQDHSVPNSRRRELYDDEEDWERLVGDQKDRKAQKQSGHQSSSISGEASGSASGHVGVAGANILMEDEEAANAATQRLLRESATRSGFGKGFKPQVAPLSSLLSKLQARQAALSAKAAQIPMTAAEDGSHEQMQQVPTLEQVRAHLERQSVVHKQQQQQQPSGATSAVAAAQHPTSIGDAGDGAMECDAAEEALALAGDADDIDDFFVEPAAPQEQQTEAAAAAAAGQRGCGLPPDTQQTLLDELPALQRGPAAAADDIQAVGTEMPSELDLHLGDDMEEAAVDIRDQQQQQQQQTMAGAPCGRGQQAGKAFLEAEAEETSDGQDAAAGSQDDHDDGSNKEGPDEMEDSGCGGSVSGDDNESDGEAEDESESDPLADLSLSEEDEEQQREPEVEPEPLNWEEEEGLGQGSQGSQQQQHRVVGRRVNAAKLVAKLRHKAAAFGFVDAEAELSDDEEAGDLSEDEDGDEDEDGMLEELLADATEGRLDETRRASLHARWADAQEAKEIRELLNAIRNGFRKKRRLGAGLEGDEDEEGTDAEARRRRARLLGLTDGDGDGDGGEEDGDDAVITGTDRLQRLDFSLRPEDDLDPEAEAAAVAAEQAARQKRQQLAKLTKQASESQQDGDVMQLMQIEVDEDSQHTVDLLTKSFSVPAALPSAAAAQGGSSGGSSREVMHRAASSRGPSNLRHASGPSLGQQPDAGAADTAAAAAAAAAGQGAAGRTGGAAVGLAAGRKAGNKQTAATGFNFTVFGKDIEAAGGNAALKTTSSFIGRQGSSSVAVRSASNFGASRTFVFGSDLSNFSNPTGGNSNQGAPVQQHHGQDNRGGAGNSKLAAGGQGLGASSFAGLGKLIAEGKGAAAGSKQGGSAALGGSGGSSVLLNVLHHGAGTTAAASAPGMIHAAVGTKLSMGARAHGSNPGGGRA